MTDERGTSNLDKSIAAVTVLADTELLPAVVDFVRRAAHQLGLRYKATEHLGILKSNRRLAWQGA